MWNRVPLLVALLPGSVVVPSVAVGTTLVGIPGYLAALVIGVVLPLLVRRSIARIPSARRVALVSAAARVRLGPDRRISWRGATAWMSRLAVVALPAALGLYLAGYVIGAAWFAVAVGYLHGAAVSISGRGCEGWSSRWRSVS